MADRTSRSAIGRWAARLDAMHSSVRRRWYARSPRDRRWIIVPYLTFGTRARLGVSGRVLRYVEHRPPSATDSGWRNAAEFWKRMESDEFPGARVRARLGETSLDLVADDEGHFSGVLEPSRPLEDDGWHTVDLALADAPAQGKSADTVAHVLVPADTARFGVISDIDDTVVWSDVAHKLRMLAMLVRGNARTRKPFKGVAAFYRALHRGLGGDERNPVFYVSGSPWNLYDPLVDFLQVQGLPRGPLMLKDFGEHLLFEGTDHRAHKRRCIEQVFASYPALPFVLIGDSGEQDPEIYSELVRDHPGRVRAVYIRSVDPHPSRVAAIDELVRSVKATGVELVLAADSEAAAAHAVGQGLIPPEALDQVREDKRDEQA